MTKLRVVKGGLFRLSIKDAHLKMEVDRAPRKNTRDAWRVDIDSFVEFLGDDIPAVKITRGQVESYKEFLVRSFAPASVNRKLSTVKTLGAWLEKQYPRYRCPYKDILGVGLTRLRPKRLTPVQADAVIETCKRLAGIGGEDDGTEESIHESRVS